MDDILKRAEIKPKSSNEEYTIPFDVIHLPSKGLLYKDGPLAGLESVECHYLTAIQEDILTSPNLLSSGKMLDALLKSVLKDKSIDPSKLTLGDRNAIIIWLRSTGYGSDYPVSINCRSCGKDWENSFDLGGLKIRELEIVPNDEGLFELVLPQTKAKILFRFITSEDEITILRKVEAAQRKQGAIVDNSMSLKMMTSIVEVNGNRDPFVIRKFVEFMPVRDSRAFREYVNNNEPGVIMSQECECTSCGNVSTEVIPIRGNFFWPDSGV